MPHGVTRSEVDQLVRLYRTAVREISDHVIERLDLSRPHKSRSTELLLVAGAILDRLDVSVASWSRRNLGRAYRNGQADTIVILRKAGLLKKIPGHASIVTRLNRKSLESLILDPTTGMVPSLVAATKQLRNRIRSMKLQIALLKNRRAAIGESASRLSSLSTLPPNVIAKRVATEAASLKPVSDRTWRNRLSGFGDDNVLKSFAELALVKIGLRTIRIDDYADLVGTMKAQQSYSLGSRNKMIQHGVGLVIVVAKGGDPTPRDIGEGCDPFIGKAFAITDSASTEFGVPRVEEIPFSGPPFHPYCVHEHIPFIPERYNRSQRAYALASPPRWALGRSFAEVNAETKRRFVGRGGKRRRAK